MALPPDRKLYLGPRLRVLRRELGLNQTRMAEELGVSPSYLNHLERNQRPLTAQILLRLAHTYDIDVREFVAGANEAAASDLHEIFADALVRDIGIPRHEVMEVAENYPSVAEAVTRLYGALRQLRRMPERIEQLGAGASTAAAPIEWLRDYLDHKRNHLAELDRAAEMLSQQLGEGPEVLRDAMMRRLGENAGITVQVMPAQVMVGALRHFDYHRRRLMLSEQLPPASRLFAISYQLALKEFATPLEEAIARAAPPDAETVALVRIAFANYAAAAVLMPYGRFLAAAEESRYDLDLLCTRFGVSYEQAAHRVTTLGRPDAAGVPFFFIKLDSAGNVAKQLRAGLLPPLATLGGCARWDLQRAFRLPGETIVAQVEFAPEARLVSFGRAIPRTNGRGQVAIILGCAAEDAGRVAGAAAQEPAIPIGTACHLCERPDCEQRALPPVTRTLDLQPYQRPSIPYPFRPL